MSHGVWTDLFLYAGLLGITLDDVEDHHATQGSAEAVQKDIVLKTGFDVEFVAELEVVVYLA